MKELKRWNTNVQEKWKIIKKSINRIMRSVKCILMICTCFFWILKKNEIISSVDVYVVKVSHQIWIMNVYIRGKYQQRICIKKQ